MGDTLKWPKDTATIVKVRAQQAQEMSKAEAMLSLRLQVADDIESFIEKEFPADKTREEMLLTLSIFRFYAQQAPTLRTRLKSDPNRLQVLKAFIAQCGSKFGGRGGNALMGAEEMFADSEDVLYGYLQRGLVDLVTCWSSLSPGDRAPLVRSVLDSPKNYATTLDMTEAVVFGDAKTIIQRWKPASKLTMADILEDWLSSEANDSIYTGVASGGTRQGKRAQLEKYSKESQDPEAYHLCWSSVVNCVVGRKQLQSTNHNEIMGFFQQNIPAIVETFRPMVPEQAVREFVNDYLPTLLRNPVYVKKNEAPASGLMELAPGELNKLKEVAMPLQVKLVRATNEDDRQKILDESFTGKTFTRRIDDKPCTFERYDATTKKYIFKLA